MCRYKQIILPVDLPIQTEPISEHSITIFCPRQFKQRILQKRIPFSIYVTGAQIKANHLLFPGDKQNRQTHLAYCRLLSASLSTCPAVKHCCNNGAIDCYSSILHNHHRHRTTSTFAGGEVFRNVTSEQQQ